VGQEGPDDPDTAPSRCEHEGRVAIRIGRDSVCARLQQQLHHGLMAPQTRPSERRAAGRVPIVHFSPLAHQVARDVQVAVNSSANQRCAVAPIVYSCVEERAIRPDAGLHGGQVAPSHILQQVVHATYRGWLISDVTAHC
jgi:tRNA A37 threonylcarbamoyladenosine synthetase subunit TsaC/SUA5/YrdC